MKKKLLVTLLALACILACAFGFAACNNVVSATSVTLNKTELTLAVGNSETLTATILPENTTNKTAYWSSENENIATVDANGKVTAYKEGTTVITATANAASATCTVTVIKIVPVRTIFLYSTALLCGTTQPLTASVFPDDATSEIVWSVEPESVATVNQNTITAISQGEATLTATADGVSAKCTVTVTEDGMQYVLNEDGESYMVDGNYVWRRGVLNSKDLTEAEIASEFNGKPVTKIGRSAFTWLNDLKTIKVPASITEIEIDYLIDRCTALESFIVDPENQVYSSFDGVLYNKAGTEGIYAPYAISGVVTVPGTMINIPDSMFYRREKITSVILQEGVTAIGKNAFNSCDRLHSITIPESMTEIGYNAFLGCSKLWEIYNFSHLKIVTGGDIWTATYGLIGVYALNILYMKNDPSGIHETDDGFVFYTARENKVYLVDYTGEETELTLPESYNGSSYEINQQAFYNYNFLTSVTLSNNVTAIGAWAFCYCNLDTLTISSSVTELGDCMFLAASKNIIYQGTKDQWEHIEKDNNWDRYFSGTIHCTDGDIIVES